MINTNPRFSKLKLIIYKKAIKNQKVPKN